MASREPPRPPPPQELRFSGFVKCQPVNCSGEKYKDQESQIKTVKRK